MLFKPELIQINDKSQSGFFKRESICNRQMIESANRIKGQYFLNNTRRIGLLIT